MTYTPKENDYVKWKGHEGWVYFKDDFCVTIEIGTKNRKYPIKTKSTIHHKDHILLVCYKYQWHELEYLASRKSKYDS